MQPSTRFGRTRAYARQLAEKLDPRTMRERHAAAVDDNSITIVDLDNGMSQIIALVPTVYAHAVLDRLSRQAKAIRQVDVSHRRTARAASRAAADSPGQVLDAGEDSAGAGAPSDVAGDDAPIEASRATTEANVDSPFDDRTVDQTRADLFVDLLLTGAPAIDPTLGEIAGGLGAIHAQVQITMPVTTLTGVTQGGAEINGKAPIDPETARRLAGNTPVWDRVMFDPVTAVVLTVDRYQPTPAQRRFLRARDRHCRFPGCRRPARGCAIDHNHEHHEGGATSLCNLACLCVRHHTMKTETEWTARQLPGGRLEWSSPTGRTYLEKPPPVIFVPTDDPAPF